MREPNFIIGGTAAGGTSYLYELLIQHAEIYLPQQRIPEPHYYYKSWEYAKGRDWYLQEYFANVPSACVAIGERSSSYLYGGAHVARKIARDFPQMRFVFMLRNPVERAWANYRFTALQGLETLGFAQALAHEKERIAQSQGIWAEIQPFDYTGRGFYAKQLLEYLDFFPREQILCLKSESLTRDNLKPLYRIYRFLGLQNTDFVPQNAPIHASPNVVSAAVQKELRDYFGDRFSTFMNHVRREEALALGDVSAEERQKILQLRENLTGKKEDMPTECRKRLQETFAKDIEILQTLVDFDVSDWVG